MDKRVPLVLPDIHECINDAPLKAKTLFLPERASEQEPFGIPYIAKGSVHNVHGAV